MKLLFLGTSGYHPTERRQTSCLLLPGCGVVLDAGTGLFRLGRFLQTDEADLFLTHAHLDHCVGLTYLFSVLAQYPLKRLTIHGAAAKLDAIRGASVFRVAVSRLRRLGIFALDDGNRIVELPQAGRLTHFPLDHPGGTLGFRLDWPGHSMAYVTDTTADPAAAYVKEIEGVELLVHECYYPDARAIWRGSTAIVRFPRSPRWPRAGVGRLLLTHIDPLNTAGEHLDLAAARPIFAPLSVAEDVQEVDF